MTHQDQQYIDALINNDAALLNELYNKYSGKIKWMILQNNGSEADASDIFQEGLLALFNKAKNKGFKLTCPLDSFLYLICKNKWLNELSKRKTGRVTFVDPDGYNDIGEETFKLEEDCRLQQERQNLLTDKLEQLGDSCKQLLRLSWSNKSMEEVAETLKVTYGYARKKNQSASQL